MSRHLDGCTGEEPISDDRAQEQHVKQKRLKPNERVQERKNEKGRLVPHPLLKGQYTIEDFITEEEEERLLVFLDSAQPAWKKSQFNGPHGGKAWGVRTDLKRRTVREGEVAMPTSLMELVPRMKAAAQPLLNDWKPNEANAIDYRRQLGHYLGSHVDDRNLSGKILVNLSLAAPCYMTYTKQKQQSQQVKVLLPRRSLQLQLGEVRYTWTHSIANTDLLGDRRISVTFRNALQGREHQVLRREAQ
jgi:alkylated DNA repair dioxygenase AlkB